MIDIRRRGFLFGAAATLVVAKPKSFFIVKPPKLVTTGMGLTFDLPLQQMLDLQKKLQEQVIDITAVPRWLVLNPRQYDLLVGQSYADA